VRAVRKLSVLVLVMLVAPMAWAKVWTTVYRCDEKTPLAVVDSNGPIVYRDIMVGTRLAIVVSSDTAEYWLGGLLLAWEDEELGELTGRGNPTPPATINYKDSCLAAAGRDALVSRYYGPRGVGLNLRSSPVHGYGLTAGDWFIVDYRAERVGTCHIGLYNYSVSFDAPIQMLSLTQVPTRDFNGDGIVNFEDLGLLGHHWGSQVDPNSPEGGLDLNADRRIDAEDLTLFSEYWLEKTDCTPSAADPNKTASTR
jgi:hypothetical protein